MQGLLAAGFRHGLHKAQLIAPLLALPTCLRHLAQAAPAVVAPEPKGRDNRIKRAPSGSIVRYPFSIRYRTPKPVKLYNLDGGQIGTVQLPGDVFNIPVRVDILHQVVRWQRAKARQGTHKVKTRDEVSGGGRKPWAQKGLGKARQGSIRAPHWRGGGVVHGPTPRSYYYPLPKKVRRLGLRCALSAKAHEGRLILVDSLEPASLKTKELAASLTALLSGFPRRSALLVDLAKDGPDGGTALRQAGRNLPHVDIVPQIGANVYGILRRDVLVMTKAAAEAVAQRLQAPINRLGASGRTYQQRMKERAEARKRAAAAALQQLPYTHRPVGRSTPLFSEADREQLLAG